MELDDKKLKEEIEHGLKEIDEGKHRDHKIKCIVDVVIVYENGKLTLREFEVVQGECLDVECVKRNTGFAVLLWE